MTTIDEKIEQVLKSRKRGDNNKVAKALGIDPTSVYLALFPEKCDPKKKTISTDLRFKVLKAFTKITNKREEERAAILSA